LPIINENKNNNKLQLILKKKKKKEGKPVNERGEKYLSRNASILLS